MRLRNRRRERAANPLHRYFRENDGLLIDKWVHYLDVYHRHFERFRGQEVTVVEFGVFHGGSLRMWRDYFGRRARIVGVDIDPRCAGLGGKDILIELGDQSDRAFLQQLADRYGPIDVVIDDGGHQMVHQITTFECVFPAVADGGVYVVEDLHTSYWPEFGGGLGEPGTFIELSKRLLDQLQAWHSRDDRLSVDEHTRTIRAMHCYDSLIVFDKADVPEPRRELTGRLAFQDDRVQWPEHVLPPRRDQR